MWAHTFFIIFRIVPSGQRTISIIMRFRSVVLSLLFGITPSVSFAQNQVNGSLAANNVLLPQLLHDNPNTSIFYNALIATGLNDTLQQYLDPTYPEIDYEWTEQALRDNYEGIHLFETAYETGDNADRIAYPEKREFKFTIFCMPDAALANYSDAYTVAAGLNGIHNLAELKRYAETVYPEGAGQDDKLRTSSLNKFISYHILPCWLSYDQFNTSQIGIIYRRLYLTELDVEDFFETLLPHSIMRISTPYSENRAGSAIGIYINRKGTQSTGLIAEGARIAKDANEYNLSESFTNICINGGYYYINKLLAYDDYTRNTILNTRIRIMACTLSPDFINSHGRGRLNGDPNNARIKNIDKMVMAYLPGFCKNVKWSDDTKFYVRYRDRSFGTYYGDEMTIRGKYDITFRLPPVPADGLYEIRVWNNSLAGSSFNDRGTILFYLGKEGEDFIPCGTPVDMRLGLYDSLIGSIPDNDERYDNLTDQQRQAAIDANDKALHKRGYMKAPDSYTQSYSNDNTGDPMRVAWGVYRKIICEHFLEAGKDYYLRLRQVANLDATFPFCFVEIVPYSVYSGENGPEDKH